MANAQNGNSFYVDSTGSLTEITNRKVSLIIFTANASNDVLILKDGDTSGPIKMKIQNATAKESKWIRIVPAILFPNGIFVDTITASATATIVTSGTDQ